MKSKYLSFLLTMVLIVSSTLLLSQKPIGPLIDILQAELKEARGVGAMVSIVTSDSILYTSGVGLADRKAEIPVSEDYLFRVGSISKSFSAICLIQLLRENNYTLETPIRTILPDIPIDNQWADTHPVKVSHILQHTAGFDDMHLYAWMLPDTIQPTAQRMLDIAHKSLYVRWQPGTKFAYANPGYLLTGVLIEKLSGQPYADYIKAKMLTPIGMTSSGFYYNQPTHLSMTTGYHNEGGVFSKRSFQRVNAGAAGDLCSNGKDMAHFLQFLMNKGSGNETLDKIVAEDFGRIELPSKTLGVQNGLTGGYGLANGNSWRNGYEFHGHSGGIPGFSSNYVYSREADIGIAVSVNANGFPDRLIDKILDYYIPVDSTITYDQSKTPISDEVIEKYSGFYHFNNYRNPLLAFAQNLTDCSVLRITRDSIATFDFYGNPQSTYYHDKDNLFFKKGEGINSAALFMDGDEPVFWSRSDYAIQVNKTAKWLEFILSIAALALTIIFFLYGIVQAIVNLASDKRHFTSSFSWLWGASIAFIIGILTFSLSMVPTDKASPGFLNVTFYISTIVFFICAVIAFINYFRKHPKGIAARIFYGLSAFLMCGMGVYLMYHDIIGLRLWSY